MSTNYTDPAESPHMVAGATVGDGKAVQPYEVQPHTAQATAEAAGWRRRAEDAEAAIARVRELVDGHLNVGADDVLRALVGESTATETGDEQEWAAA